MTLSFQEFQANARFLAAVGISLGVTAWVIRRKLEADKPLDRRTRILRWSTILVGWAVASLPLRHGLVTGLPLVLAALSSAAFLWWPNSALWVARLLWKRQFAHVEAILRRWNPIGPEATDVFRPYVPQILDQLQKGADAAALTTRLGQMRLEWVRDPNPLDDHRVAVELADWWRRGRGYEAAA